MASPQHNEKDFQQSSTATGVSPPSLDTQNQGSTTTLKESVTKGATRKQRVNFIDSIEKQEGEWELPPNWCSQCLTIHKRQSSEGSYHIRTFKENLAIHQAISLGKLPKVDPWAVALKALNPPSPKPAPSQAQVLQRSCTADFAMSSDVKRLLEEATDGLTVAEKIEALYELIIRESRSRRVPAAQQAPVTQQFGSHATAATTGPLQAPKRRELCTGTFTMSPDADREFKRATEGLTAVQKMAALNELMDREDRARGNIVPAAQPQAATQQFSSYTTATTTGGYSSHYPLPWPPAPQPTGPPAKKKRKADNADERSGRTDKGARFKGAHTSIAQGATRQRASTAPTSHPNTTTAPNTGQRQPPSSNPLDSVQHTGQTTAMKIANVPETATPSKTLAKGEASAAKHAADHAVAKKAALTQENST